MKLSIRVFALTALWLFGGASCGLASAPSAAPTQKHASTADGGLDPSQIIMPPPSRSEPMRTQVGSAGNAGSDRADVSGSGGVSGELAVSGGGGASGANGVSIGQPEPAGAGAGATAGSAGRADIAGSGGRSEAGSSGVVASGGSGGAGRPSQAGAGAGGRSPAAGSGDGAATFDELIDTLSDALTAEQRARIVRAIQTNSVTPAQLNELLDAVTSKGACEGGHQTCQDMCRLVLSACPMCNINRMSAEMEQARCAAL